MQYLEIFDLNIKVYVYCTVYILNLAALSIVRNFRWAVGDHAIPRFLHKKEEILLLRHQLHS